ncbi:MAG: DUF3810 domain-containing protein [Clostridiales bacterium]
MRYKVLTIILFSLFISIIILSKFSENLTENIYSQKIYKVIILFLSFLFGKIPFSVAEIIIIICAILILIFTIFLIKMFFNKRYSKKILKTLILKLLTIFVLIYFFFLFLWGFNYNRLTYNEIQNYKLDEVKTLELKEMCEYLTKKTNYLRNKTDENESGIMKISENLDITAKRSLDGYNNLTYEMKDLSKNYGTPKFIYFSKIMLYLNISGFYFPFTGEANINKYTPDCYLPHTIAHELAHQRGFAREDEANYIGFLACKNSPYCDYQYSGYLSMLTYSMNYLYQYSFDDYKKIRKQYNKNIERDLLNVQNFYDEYETPIETLSSNINDLYLKTNKQDSGINSYGEVIYLLISDFNNDKL